MSIPSENFAPTSADMVSRWNELSKAGLTILLGHLPPEAKLLHTSFGFGPEVWLVDGSADPEWAEFDVVRMRIIGGRLVITEDGGPASPKAVAARGFRPAINIRTV